MKVIRVGQCCLLAALVVSAIACTSAWASSAYEIRGLPEIGHCVKVATGEGVYKGGLCITRETGALGKYNWAQASESEKLTFAATAGESLLTTPGHSTIKCVSAHISGEWTGPKTASVTVEYLGCTNSVGQPCSTNPLNKSEFKTLPLEGELGFIKNKLKEGKLIVVVGLDLKPRPPLTALAIYECSGATETAQIEGSVIGQIRPIDKMTTESNLVYRTRAGGTLQQYEKFENGLKDTLSTTFTTGLTSTTAATLLKVASEVGKNSVPLEIRAKEN